MRRLVCLLLFLVLVCPIQSKSQPTSSNDKLLSLLPHKSEFGDWYLGYIQKYNSMTILQDKFNQSEAYKIFINLPTQAEYEKALSIYFIDKTTFLNDNSVNLSVDNYSLSLKREGQSVPAIFVIELNASETKSFFHAFTAGKNLILSGASNSITLSLYGTTPVVNALVKVAQQTPIALAPPLDNKSLNCERVTIKNIGSRLENDPSSGSAITYSNDVFGVSYNTIPEIESSKVGDDIKLCLIDTEKNCPPTREPTKTYKATNLSGKKIKTWELPTSSHSCKGA